MSLDTPEMRPCFLGSEESGRSGPRSSESELCEEIEACEAFLDRLGNAGDLVEDMVPYPLMGGMTGVAGEERLLVEVEDLIVTRGPSVGAAC